MENKMFCFQCEQTAGCTACTGNAGVCGKKSETAVLQDELTGALVGLARAARGDTEPDENTYKMLIEGLFTTVTNVSFDDEAIQRQIEAVRREKERLVPQCGSCGAPCGQNDDFDMKEIWEAQENIRSLKSLILSGSGEWLHMLIMPEFWDTGMGKWMSFSVRHCSEWAMKTQWKNFFR